MPPVMEWVRAGTSYDARALAPARWPISTARARGHDEVDQREGDGRAEGRRIAIS